MVLPTGSEGGARARDDVFEPFLAAGAVVGGSYLQAQVKVELPARREKADRAFVYNLYVGRDTSIQSDTWTLGIELNGENNELALTPQVRKGLTRTGALGAAVGVQIPLNERASAQHPRRRLSAVGIPRTRRAKPSRSVGPPNMDVQRIAQELRHGALAAGLFVALSPGRLTRKGLDRSVGR